MKGKKSPTTPGVYRDDPDRDDAASMSSAVLLTEQEALEGYNDDTADDDLPPYTDEGASVITEPRSEYPITHSRQRPRTLDATIKQWTHEDKKGSRYYRLSPSLTTDPVALQQYIEYECSVAPRCFIKIEGWHWEKTKGNNGKTKKERATDFDFKIDVSNTISRQNVSPQQWLEVPEWNSIFLVGGEEKCYRGGRTKSTKSSFKADVEATHGKESLELWCHMFCASSSKLKTYV
jgi:hypothetical protein